MKRAPIIRNRAYFDARTRAIGAPSLSNRINPYQNPLYGKREPFLDKGHRIIAFVSIEASPVMSRGRFDKASNEIDAILAKYKPQAFFLSLITSVFVGGATVYSKGERTSIQGSNGDIWMPTDGWEVRRMYRNPIAMNKRRLGPASAATEQLIQSISDAQNDHDDNRWIYIIGVEVEMVWFK